MALLRPISKRPGLPDADVTGEYLTRVARTLESTAFLLDADVLANLEQRTGLDSFISARLRQMRENPVWTGKLLEEVRRALLSIEFPAILRREIEGTLGPMLEQGCLEVVCSPVSPPAPAGTYFRNDNISSVDELCDSLREAWASLYSVDANYFGCGNFTSRAAIIIGRNLPLLAVQFDRDLPIPGLIPVEEIERLRNLELGNCLPGFKRLLLKKAWYRQFCQTESIKTYPAFYVFYREQDIDSVAASIRESLSQQLLQISAGDGARIIDQCDIETTLREMGATNLLSDGVTSCVEVAEVIKAEFQGFATKLLSQDFLIEAFPGGIFGTKDGAFQPSTSKVSPDGNRVISVPATFSVRGERTTAGWQSQTVPEYQLSLPRSFARQIAKVAEKLSQLGEVRIEWYIAQREVYIKDLSLESRGVRSDASEILSRGSAHGVALCLRNVRSISSASDDTGRVLIEYSTGQDSPADGERLARLLFAPFPPHSTIVVAPYPSVSLLPLIPHVAGFIFERGSLLSHTAIALRERGCPALIVKDALSLIAEGQRVTIQVDGLLLEP